MTNPPRDDRLLGRLLMIGGAVLILAAVMVFASQPAELSMGDPSWSNNESTRADRSMVAFALAGLGVFTIVTGLMFSQRVRTLRSQVIADSAAPVAQGVTRARGSGPIQFTGGRRTVTASDRLADLEDLRRRGLVNDHEYQIKRNRILAAL